MPCEGAPAWDSEDVLKRERDKVTALLCAVCLAWPEVVQTVVGLPEWWERHQEEDRRREVRERQQRERAETRFRALDKLTADERYALGLRP